MAGTARRTEDRLGSDAMRRLIARPIHIKITPPVSAEPVLDMTPEAMASPAPEDETGIVARLRAEVVVMKAVLAAERKESAALRASMGLDENAALGPEARAMRDRWARLVDHLLHAPR